jgi:hypothetical protein
MTKSPFKPQSRSIPLYALSAALLTCAAFSFADTPPWERLIEPAEPDTEAIKKVVETPKAKPAAAEPAPQPAVVDKKEQEKRDKEKRENEKRELEKKEQERKAQEKEKKEQAKREKERLKKEQKEQEKREKERKAQEKKAGGAKTSAPAPVAPPAAPALQGWSPEPQPATPAEPKKQAAPAPAKPAEPAKSAEPAKTEAQPKPAEPAKAEAPPKPAEPAKVEAPPKPAEPAKVEAPPKPAEPAKVEAPPKPAEPAKVEAPPKPAEPAKVEAPPKPAEPAKVETPPKPAEPTKVETQPKPAEPVKAEAQPKPAEPAKAATPAKPAEPAKAAKPAKPAEPAKAEPQPAPAEPVKVETQPKPAEPAASGTVGTVFETSGSKIGLRAAIGIGGLMAHEPIGCEYRENNRGEGTYDHIDEDGHKVYIDFVGDRINLWSSLSGGASVVLLSRINSTLGVSCEIQYSFYVSSGELVYRADKAGNSHDDAYSWPMSEATVELHALEIPVLLRINAGTLLDYPVYAEVGPQFGFNLYAKKVVYVGGTGGLYMSEEKEAFDKKGSLRIRKPNVNVFEFGPVLGAGFDLDRVSVGLRLYIGAFEYVYDNGGWPWSLTIGVTSFF